MYNVMIKLIMVILLQNNIRTSVEDSLMVNHKYSKISVCNPRKRSVALADNTIQRLTCQVWLSLLGRV